MDFFVEKNSVVREIWGKATLFFLFLPELQQNLL